MYTTITFLFSAIIILSTLLTIGRNMMESFVEVSDAWFVLQERSESRTNTRISGPTGLILNVAPTVQMTLANEGDTPLAKFSDWDVIFEVQQNPGMGIAYLDYTENPSPGSNEWTVSGIYRDASTLTAEVVDPGVLNADEEMIILANPSPSISGGVYDRAVFATPNGIVTKVIFRVSDYLYVVDRADLLVYRYLDDGTFDGFGFLDSENDDAQGITTDDTDFWTSDATDDEAYKYNSSIFYDSKWSLDILNADSTGITTDGSGIWIVDGVFLKVFKYDMSGNPDPILPTFALNVANISPVGITTDGTNIWIVDNVTDTVYKHAMTGGLDTSFPLTADNADPTGITTNGNNIWVVDIGDFKIYKYDMSGSYVSGADITLDSTNTDPQGITIRPR